MKKLLFGTVLLVGLIIFPFMSLAQVNVHVKVPIPLPPPIPFIGPPKVVVLPGTDVYAVPDVEQELFFRGGWWWRPWGGHWYRSKYHDHGWAYYRNSPSWYRGIPRDWRGNYRNHMWGGHSWKPPHINHSNLNNHWRGGHWRNDHGWARPKPPRGRTLHGGGPGGGGRSGGGPGGRTLHDGGKGGRTHPDGRMDRRDGGGPHRGDRRQQMEQSIYQVSSGYAVFAKLILTGNALPIPNTMIAVIMAGSR